MKIAIVGYGKMGRMIERIAVERGHTIVARFNTNNNAGGEGLIAKSLNGVEAAIEFSTPDTAIENIRRLVALRVPTVVGTTGWYGQIEEIKQLVESNHAALVRGANFSIG